MKCLRCGEEIPEGESSNSQNYYQHSVCAHCRTFMEKRMNHLIKADKEFHKSEKEDFEITKLYLRSLFSKKTKKRR